MLPLFSKKTSWILLVILFTFDNILSYWAIVYRGAHESDLAIAWLVEEYPLLYFLCIPALVVMIYGICKLLMLIVRKYFKKVNEKLAEKIILTSIVFYWAIGNSSFNFLYLIGHSQPSYVWFATTMVMLVLTVIYTLNKLKKEKS